MHFLGSGIGVPFMVGPQAFVRVRVDKKAKTLKIEIDEKNPIEIAKSDVQWVELPGDWKVVDPDGKKVVASGVFCVTVETFDPCHGITDLAKDKRRW